MSNDIVKRLRDPSLGSPRWMDTMAEGADCIESQAARIAKLEVALRAVNWRLLQTYEFGKCRSECLRIIDDALTGGEDE